MRFHAVATQLLALVAAAVLFAAPVAAHAGDGPRSAAPPDSGLSDTDKEVIRFMARQFLVEAQMANLVPRNSRSEPLKTLAKEIERDDDRALAQLMALATLNRIDMSLDYDAQQQVLVDRLGALSGDSFDQAYIAEAARHHTAAILMMLNTILSSPSHAEVKEIAARLLLPTQQHLVEAKQMAAPGED